MAGRPPPRIVVAHPERQHSYQTALAVQEQGWLLQYLTGFYYKTGFVSSAVRLLRPRLEAQLLRRRLPEIDQTRVRSFPWGELLNRAGLMDFHSKIGRFDRRVARYVRRTTPSAVICYDTCALETFKAATEVGAVRILDQTGGHLTQAQKIFKEHGIDFPVADWMVRQSIEEARAADFVLAGSEYVKDSLENIGVPGGRVHLLPYGVDIEAFRPGDATGEEGLRILFVGRVSHTKGIHHLVAALSELNFPRLTLHVVGWSFDDAAWVRQHAGKVIYHAQVASSEIPELYRRCDIFVAPSLHEGSSLVTYEALASGLPVITTRNAGSVVTDGVDGFIVPVGDTAALKDRILLLCEDTALLRQMSRNARTKAEQYPWVGYRRRLGDILREMLANSPAS
jgi:glycosyltransferase involved in cell wall biosynthesis